MSFVLIETKTLGSSASNVEFTSIPQDATDLMLTASIQLSVDSVEFRVRLNGDTGSNYTTRRLYGGGGAAGTDGTSTTYFPFYGANASSFTSDTFSNGALYFANYTTSKTKTISADTVTENNNAESYTMITNGIWNSTAAITSILLLPPSGNFLTNTTFSLYKITKGSDGIVTTS
jgi:hypothetical protein